MISYNCFYWGPILYKTKITAEILQNIKKICKKNPKKSHVKNLAGDIKHEYLINEKILNKLLQPYIESFREAYLNWYGNPINPVFVNRCWVNYMKPGDYNPVHTHTGCDFSGVIYLDIPSKLQKEISEYQGNHDGPGAIYFLYGETNSYCITNISSKPVAGDIYIFPYGLKHAVNPHKSNCERVSIGVNFAVKGGIHDK